jgi:hypothetical protein
MPSQASGGSNSGASLSWTRSSRANLFRQSRFVANGVEPVALTFGEILDVISRVTDGDFESWVVEWNRTTEDDRLQHLDRGGRPALPAARPEHCSSGHHRLATRPARKSGVVTCQRRCVRWQKPTRPTPSMRTTGSAVTGGRFSRCAVRNGFLRPLNIASVAALSCCTERFVSVNRSGSPLRMRSAADSAICTNRRPTIPRSGASRFSASIADVPRPGWPVVLAASLHLPKLRCLPLRQGRR